MRAYLLQPLFLLHPDPVAYKGQECPLPNKWTIANWNRRLHQDGCELGARSRGDGARDRGTLRRASLRIQQCRLWREIYSLLRRAAGGVEQDRPRRSRYRQRRESSEGAGRRPREAGETECHHGASRETVGRRRFTQALLRQRLFASCRWHFFPLTS